MAADASGEGYASTHNEWQRELAAIDGGARRAWLANNGLSVYGKKFIFFRERVNRYARKKYFMLRKKNNP